jgi:hypothetical protein
MNRVSTSFAVIVLGDTETGRRADSFADEAAAHGALITGVHTFDPGEARGCGSLTDVDAVMSALSRALTTSADIWVPFPVEDLGREQHVGRLSLVLQRHGLNLRLGRHLQPCPASEGVSEVDCALHVEVHAVDELDRAALATTGFTTLQRELELALAERTLTPTRPWEGSDVLKQGDGDFDPGAALPPPTAPWSQRHPALKRYATWLMNDRGLNQGRVAQLINGTGHRTPQGRDWRQATISNLIAGRYERSALQSRSMISQDGERISPEAKRILDVFRARGVHAGEWIHPADFGDSVIWEDGFVRDDAVRQALGFLFNGRYLVELNAGFELTAKGEDAMYGRRGSSST